MPDYKMRVWGGQRQYFGSDSSNRHRIRDRSKYDAITLERGETEDSEFADWAATVVANGGSAQSGGNSSSPPKVQGQSQYDSITLERGVTQDPGFANWAAGASGSSAAGGHKSIHLEFYDESGNLLVKYRISRGWVSEYPTRPPGGLLLHSLYRRDGKPVQQKLAGIFAESLRRLS
jgi:hypothetical protein